jgi:hypothetical protein
LPIVKRTKTLLLAARFAKARVFLCAANCNHSAVKAFVSQIAGLKNKQKYKKRRKKNEMKNQTEIERLEELILNGGNVSPAELADATRNSDAEKRISQLTAERTIRNAQSDLEQLAALNRRVASDNLPPTERIVTALEILNLEQKNTGENKQNGKNS